MNMRKVCERLCLPRYLVVFEGVGLFASLRPTHPITLISRYHLNAYAMVMRLGHFLQDRSPSRNTSIFLQPGRRHSLPASLGYMTASKILLL
jgi:hypothetical protein